MLLHAGQNATGKVILAVIDATDRIVESDEAEQPASLRAAPLRLRGPQTD